jgi:hypothetical protein
MRKVAGLRFVGVGEGRRVPMNPDVNRSGGQAVRTAYVAV